jgi:hypothetical protein
MTRARRRWLIVAAAVVAVLIVYVFSRETTQASPEVQKASSIALGMTQGDVLKIMGQQTSNGYFGNGESGMWFGEPDGTTASVRWIKQSLWERFRIPLKTDYDDFPVHIRFDAAKRVDRIKRGDEIVEAPPK